MTSDAGGDDPMQPILGFVGDRSSAKSAYLVARLDRLLAYRLASVENETKLNRALLALARSPRNEVADPRVSIFLGLPDEPDDQPFTGLSYGRRTLDPRSIKEKYEELAASVDRLRDFFSGADSLHQLLADQGENEHAKSASPLYQAGAGSHLRRNLNWLSSAFKGADPHQWSPTNQPLAKDAKKQTYVKLIADLNRYLIQPKHAALAALANANNPACPVAADQLRKAWERTNLLKDSRS